MYKANHQWKHASPPTKSVTNTLMVRSIMLTVSPRGREVKPERGGKNSKKDLFDTAMPVLDLQEDERNRDRPHTPSQRKCN